MSAVCYLQEDDDPRDHDPADGMVCARCYDALAEQVSEAAELFEDMLQRHEGVVRAGLRPHWSGERAEQVRDVIAMLRGYKRCLPIECPPVEPFEINATYTVVDQPAVLLFDGVPILFVTMPPVDPVDGLSPPFRFELEAAERLGIADRFRVAGWVDAFPLVGDRLSESLASLREAVAALVADSSYDALIREFGHPDLLPERGSDA